MLLKCGLAAIKIFSHLFVRSDFVPYPQDNTSTQTTKVDVYTAGGLKDPVLLW